MVMRANLAALCLSIFAGATALSAQTAPQSDAPGKSVDYSYVYCSGFASDPKIPDDIRVVSGEQSNYKIAWVNGEYIHINRGTDKGVKVGDRFVIARPEHDIANEWFYGQKKLEKGMGTLYTDAGQARVVKVESKFSTAKLEFTCDYVKRGDIARPFEERPLPPFKEAAAFVHFAPVSGKPVGIIVSARDYFQMLGRGDTMYVNVGAAKGVKVGDRFSVVRAEKDPIRVQWFKWQDKLTKAMGTHYADLGELQVIKSETNVAIAKISMSCAFMQRGDIVRPFVERPAGPYKQDAALDILAPVSGKAVAMVVHGKDTEQTSGRWGTVYVNLGAAQGVKVGDYFRIFRYQGSTSETIPVERGYQDHLYGYGSNPRKYNWNDLPREVLGEGIVLNASQNSSTVLVTAARAEIYSGDYIEVE